MPIPIRITLNNRPGKEMDRLPETIREEGIYLADQSTVGATRTGGPRPQFLKPPLVTADEERNERPYNR